jgi:hypothetical protein
MEFAASVSSAAMVLVELVSFVMTVGVSVLVVDETVVLLLLSANNDEAELEVAVVPFDTEVATVIAEGCSSIAVI